MSAMQGTAGSGAEVKAFIIPAFRGFHVDEERDKCKDTLNRMSSSSAQEGHCQRLPRNYQRVPEVFVGRTKCEWDLA